MKKRLWPLSSGFCLVLASGVVALAAPAAHADTQATTVVRHYDDVGQVMAVGAAQCGKALPERSGAWMCGTTQAMRPASLSGTCSGIVCWYENSTQSVEEDIDGVYGYGGTTLGDIDAVITDTFNGGSSTTRPFWLSNTRGIASWACSGERLYFSAAYPNGRGVSSGASFRSAGGGSVSPFVQIRCFGSTGYTYFENTVAWAGVAHQFQWTDPEFPGTWWFYTISPKFQHQGSAYFSLTPMALPPAPWQSGWEP